MVRQVANGLDQHAGNFSALFPDEENQQRGGIYQCFAVRLQPVAHCGFQKLARLCCDTFFLLSGCFVVDRSMGLGWTKFEDLLAKAFLSDGAGWFTSWICLI